MKYKAQAAIVEVGTREAKNEGPFKTQIHIPFRRNSAEALLSQGNSNTHLSPTASSEALLTSSLVFTVFTGLHHLGLACRRKEETGRQPGFLLTIVCAVHVLPGSQCASYLRVLYAPTLAPPP